MEKHYFVALMLNKTSIWSVHQHYKIWKPTIQESNTYTYWELYIAYWLHNAIKGLQTRIALVFIIAQKNKERNIDVI